MSSLDCIDLNDPGTGGVHKVKFMNDEEDVAELQADILARRKHDRRIIRALIDEDAEALVTSVAEYIAAKGIQVPRELADRIPVKPDN